MDDSQARWILTFLLLITQALFSLQNITRTLVTLDNEITELMESMSSDKLDKLIILLEAFDNKLEELVDYIDVDDNAAKARSVMLEYMECLERDWSRRVPRCIGLDWDGHRLMRRFNWTEDNMDDLMTQVGGVQYDWECLEGLLGMATTEGTTRRTRPTRSIRRKPTGVILTK